MNQDTTPVPPKYDPFDWNSWLKNSLPGQWVLFVFTFSCTASAPFDFPCLPRYWNLAYFLIAAATYAFFWPDLAECQTLRLSWMLPVLMRNLVVMCRLQRATRARAL